MRKQVLVSVDRGETRVALMEATGTPAAKSGRFVGMDLTQPEIDMVGLAKSLGVPAERVTEPDELAEKVARSLAGDGPRLFDVPIERTLTGPG